MKRSTTAMGSRCSGVRRMGRPVRLAAQGQRALVAACQLELLENRWLLSHVFTPSETAALEDGLNRFANWTDILSTQTALGQQVAGVGTSLGGALDLKNAVLNQIYSPVATYLATPGATDVGLSAELKTLSAVSGNLVITVNPAKTSGGEIAGPNGSAFEYELAFTVQRTVSNTPIDLGERWHALNITPDVSGAVTFSAGATLDMFFGLGEASYTAAPNAFYTRFQTLSFTGVAHAAGLNFNADIGMLGAHVVNGALDVSAAATISVTDPDHDAAGAITLSELEGTAISALAAVTPSGTANIVLPVTASFGSYVPSGTPTLSLISGNIFQAATTQMVWNTAFAPLTNFGSMRPADVVPAIQQIASSFTNIVAGSPLGTVNLPFVPSRSLASILDFTGIFSGNISSVLSSGGVPTFHNAQTLESTWAAALGVSPSSLSGGYDPATHLLTWHISAGNSMSASTAPINLTAGLQPLSLTSSTGTVSITANANLDTIIGIRLDPMVAAITGAASLPANGRFVGTSTFQLRVGDAAPVTVTVAGSGTNLGIDNLVADFNTALSVAKLNQEVIAQRSGLRLSFATLGAGVAPKITIYAVPTDVMVTQFGFTNGQSDQPNINSQVFLQNTSLDGNASATVSGVSAVGKFGMLGVGVAGGSGTMYMAGGFKLSASNSAVAGSQVTAADLLANAASMPGNFAKQLTLDGNATMTLPITVNAGFLSLPALVSPSITVNWTHAPNPATLSLAYNGDMSSLLDFTKVMPGDLSSSLTGISSLLGLADGGSVLSQKLPLLDQSLAGLLSLSDTVNGKLSGLSLSGKTLQQVGPAIEGAFSLPSGAVTVQMDGHLLRITFNVTASASGNQTLSLDLDKLVAELPEGNPVKGFLQGMSKLVAGGASGHIAYSAGATLHVSAGVDLTDPSHPKPFIDDSTHADVSLQVNGTSLSFGATLGPLGVKIDGGTAKIGATLDPGTVDSAAFSIGVTPSGTGRHLLSEIDASAFSASLTGAVHAVLPLYFPLASTFVGNLDISIGNLGDIPGSLAITAPDIHQLGLNMDLSNNMDGLLEGLGALLDQIQSSLGKQVLSQRLPLVGDKLGSAVDFIGGALRSSIYNKLKAAFDNAAALGVSKGVDVARQGLYEALGPSGLNILVPTGAYGDYRDIDFSSVGSGIDTSRVEFKLHLHQAATLVSIPLNFDLGLPGLGLSATGDIQLKAGYDINLWFGVDKSDGFFLDTSSPEEVKLDLDASIPGASLTGNLLFLQLQLRDNPAHPTHFGASFAIDLQSTGDELTLGNLGSIVGGDFVHAKLTAEANVDLLIVTSFGGNAAFPSLDANFLLNWKFSPTDPDLSGSAPEIAFKNVRVDAGEFLSSFMAPIIDKVKAVIDPIKPVLDVLTAHIPGLYDVAPDYGTLVKIAEQFGLVEGADGIEALAGIAKVVDDFSKMTTIESGHAYINLGDFDLGGADPRSPTFNTTNVDPNVTLDVGDASNQLPSDPETQAFWSDTQDLGSQGIKMEFPLLQNPKDAFRLLLGQDVNIFTLDLPAIHLGLKAGVKIPVYSVGVATVYLNLGGTLDVQGKVAFGYDTSGIREFVSDASHNPADIFDGFYISTRRNADGTGGEMPFLSATGELKAGISVDFCDIVEVGADGGLGFTVGAYLQDPNNDGKLHVSEMITEMGEGFLSTVKISGSIYALFDVWVEIKIPLTPFHYTWELFNAKVTLVDVTTAHPGTTGDRFAPNTKRASAADLGVGPGIHLTGLSLKAGAEDWFHFDLLRPDSIDVATSCAPSLLNTVTEVYDKNGKLLATTAGDNSGLKTLTLNDLPADTYFVHVTDDGATSLSGVELPYGLSVTPSATSTTHVYYVSAMLGTSEPFYSMAPGFDANDGLTPWTPKATVQSLIDQYALGSTALVLIDTGKYADSVTIGATANGAIFAGSPRGSVYTNRATSPEPVVSWTVADGANNRITDLQFDYAGNMFGATAFRLTGGSNNTVDHIQIRGFGTGITDAATNDQIVNNQVQATIGIEVKASATGTLVQSNSVSTDGTGIKDYGSHVVIANNSVGHLHSLDYGTAIDIEGSDTQVLNNITKMTLYGIVVHSSGGSTLISGNSLLGIGYVPPLVAQPFGISIGGSGSVHVTGNSVQKFDVGVLVTRDGTSLDGNTVSGGRWGIDVQASNVVVGPSDQTTQSGNDVNRNTVIGIRIKDELSGVQVFLNRVHDNGTGIDSSSTTNIYSNDVFANNVGINSAGGIVGPSDWTTPNLVHDNTTGIQTGANTLIHFNRIYANQDGIVAADGDSISHNAIFRNTAHGILDTGHANVSIVSNTVYLTGGEGLRIQGSSTNTTVRNNIFEADGGGYDIYVASNSQVGFVSDHNNLYRTGAGKLVWFEKDFADLYDWQIESDLDLHSIGYIAPNPGLDAPQFVDLAGDNYILKATSTSIDSGDPASSYSLEPALSGGNIDLGAYGNTAQATTSAASYVRIDYPNLYIDWEANRARNILWHTYNLSGNVRLELWQEGGGKVADIGVVAASTGTFLWSPANSGITPDPLMRYRIRIVSVSTPAVSASAREFFSVPPESANYYINDNSTSGDEYASVVGDNRNTGRFASAPKADLLPILRGYPLTANDVVHVDTGSYIDVRSLAINYNVDVTKPNPGTGLGDDQGFSVVGPLWHTATLDRANPGANTTHVDISASNFINLSHLVFLGGSAGIAVHDGSRNFNGDHLTVASTDGDGIWLDNSAVSSSLDSLSVHDNAGYGVRVAAKINSLNDSDIHDNGKDGINISNASGIVIQRNSVRANQGYGMYLTTVNQPALIGSTDLASLAGNTVADNAQYGIALIDSAGGSTIAGNVITGQIGPYQYGIYLGGGTNTHVTMNVLANNYTGVQIFGTGVLLDNNRIYGNTHSGVDVSTNNQVRSNTIYDNAIGINAWNYDGVIANNTLYGNTQDGVIVDAGAAGYAASGPVPHPTVLSNTIRQSGGIAVRVQGSSNSVEIRNNIISLVAATGISVSNNSQTGFVSDYNLFSVDGGSEVGYWQGVDRISLPQWRNAIYGDVHSIATAARFVNAAAGDLHLQSEYGSNHGGSSAPVLAGLPALPAANPGVWAYDAATSPAIDRGDASLSFANEPSPNGNYANLGAESNTPLASKSPSSYVLVTGPSDGVVWPEAQAYSIEWRTQDGAGTVTIELLEGASVVRTLAASAPNTGSFAWTLPTDLAPASDYAVRVTRNDGSGASGDSPSPFVIAPVTHTYYVATTGDDSSSGLDPAHPKSSIRGVFFSYHVGFGDTIQVGAGTYGLSTNIFLDPASSGITITGSTDAANPTILDRQNTSGGAYVFQMTGASYVTLDHLAMTGAATAIYDNYTDTADHLTVSNDDIYDNASYGINLQAATHSTILNNTFHSSSNQFQAWDLAIYGDNNTIQGNTITGANNSYGGVAIDARGARMTVLNNVVSNINQGIQLTFNAPASPTAADLSIVSGNQIHNIVNTGLNASGYAIVSYNTIWNTVGSAYGGALYFGGVLGSLLTHNIVYNNTNNGIYASGTTTVSNNFVYGNGAAGILTYGNVTVQGNSVYSNGTGITGAGPILNNTVYSNTTQGIWVEGTGGLSNSTHPTILNNTIYQPSGIGITVSNSSSKLDIRNNIIVVAGGPAYSIAADSQSGFTADYNIVNTSGGGYAALWGASVFSALSSWSNSMGFDTHSLTADPRFISPAGADGQLGVVAGVNHGFDDNFHLSMGTGGEFPQPATPAIDAGDPSSYYLSEPQPNGNRVNIGADGNTALANLSDSPAIQITSPAAGDQLQEGQSYPINWQSIGLAGQAPVAFINSGGPKVGKWGADNYDSLASGGSLYSWAYANAIDTTGLTNPAPQSVYQSAVYNYGSVIGYDLPVPDGTYTLRLHFVEPGQYINATARRFDIQINGTTRLANYSIFGHAGATYKADIQQFTVSASGGTGIQLRLNGLTPDNGPLISGVELLADNASGLADPRFNVDVSVDNGANWSTVATNLPADPYGTGSYNWTAGPASDGNVAILRVTSADNGAVVGQTQPFQVAPSGHSFYINDGSTAGDEYTTAVGNDTNNGKMPSRPMATLSALLAAYSPHAGDTIYVDSGTYNLTGAIVLTGAYSGVRILGPTSHQAVITRNSGVTYGAFAIQISGANNVTLDHLTITGSTEGIHGDAAYSPANSVGLTITNSTIYGNYQYGINLGSGNNDAVITGNTIYGIPGSWSSPTVQTYGISVGGNGALIANNNVYQSGSQGVYVTGSGSTISGNTVHDSGQYGIYSYGVNTVTGNTVYGQTLSSGRGIYVSGGTTTGNNAYGNLVGIEAGGTGTVLSGNRVYNNSTDGLLVAATVLTRSNAVFSNGVGVSVAYGSPDLFGRVSGNLIYANSIAGVQVSGASWNSSTGAHLAITGNTIYQPSADGIQITGGSKYVELRDNIIDVGAGYVVKIDADSAVGMVSDYNLLHAFGGAKVGRFGNVDLPTPEDWYYNTLLDDHSGFGDPLFIDPAGVDAILGYATGADHGTDDNFHLQGGSMAIDAGDPASVYAAEPQPSGDRVNLGYDGNTPLTAVGASPAIILRGPSGHQRVTVGTPTTIRWGSVGITAQSPVALINCGGASVGNFSANVYETLGSSQTSSYAADASGIVDPAPASVYRSYAMADYGVGQKLQYQIPVPDGTYTVRMHFVDTSSYAGGRVFDIRLNGSTVRAAYDIAGDAGAANRVVQQTFTTTASGGQGINLELVNDTYSAAIISAIEVLRDNVGTTPSPTFNVQLSTNGGGSWSTLASGLTVDHLGEGSFNWTPLAASNNAILRVISSGIQADSSPLMIAPAGHEYYINDNSTAGDTLTTAVGSNASTGKSPDQPMATLQALLALYSPTTGDTVHVDNGSYTLVGNILLTSANNGLLIQGPTAGNALFTRSYHYSSSTQTAAFQMVGGVTNLTLDHLTITGGDYGIFGLSDYSNAVSSHLTVSNSTVFNNGTTGIWLGQHNDFAAVTNSNVYGNLQNGIDITGTDATISGNSVHNNSYTGISVSGVRGLVQNNQVWASSTGISESAGISTPATLISGNTVHDNSGYGISANATTTQVVGNTVYGQTSYGTGIRGTGQFTGNTVYNNTYGITAYSSGGSTSTVSGNRVFHNTNYGISINGNGVVSGNRVYSNPIGIEADGSTYSPFIGRIEDNLVYSNASQGIQINAGGSSYWTAQVSNNTIYQPVGDALRIQTSSTALMVRNNIIQANTGYGIYVSADSQGANVTSDWNLMVRQNTPSSRVGFWGGADRLTLADWQAATGRDASSATTTDARFMNIMGADNVLAYDTTQSIDGGVDDNFQLSAGSPAIDRGTEWAGPTTDLLSHVRVDDPGTTNSGSHQAALSQLSSSLFSGTTGVSQGWSGSYTYWTLNLPFTFPFYDQAYSQVYVSSAGYLQFATSTQAGDNSNSTSNFIGYARIAPMWDWLNTSAVYVDSSVANQITIRWVGTNQNYYTYPPVNFAATLFSNGSIRFDYGSGNNNLSPTVGISAGDSIHYKLASYDGSSYLANAKSLFFDRSASGFTDLGAYEFTGKSNDPTPTVVTGTIPVQVNAGGTSRLPISAITLSFNHALSTVDAVIAGLYDLRNSGVDGIYGTADDTLITLVPQYTADSLNVTLNILGGSLPQGNYRLTVFATSPRAMHDASGLVIDGDSSGAVGGNFVRDFVMGPPDIAPAITLVSPLPVNEGVPFTQDASFNDPDAGDAWTATVNYGDGSGVQSLTLNPDQSFHLSHNYADNGTYTIAVSVTDSFGLSDTRTISQTVSEVAPTAAFGNNGPILEGATATVSFTSPFDPSTSDATAFRYSYDFNNDGIFEITNSTSASANVPAGYLPVGSGSITIRGRILTPSDGVSTTYTTSLTVNNVLPTLTVNLNAAITTLQTYTANGSFADPGTGETYTATVDYGDGAGPQPLTLQPNKTFTLSHAYASAGSYDVIVSISDGSVSPATATGTASVSNPAVIPAAGIDISCTQGLNFTGDIASFTPFDGTIPDDYQVTVDFGDGINDGWTTVYDGGDGKFYVQGSRTYSSTDGSPFTITTTITHPSLGLATIHSTATVAAPVYVTLTATGLDITPFRGTFFSGPIASFTPLAGTNAKDYRVSVDWGDAPVVNIVTLKAAFGIGPRGESSAWVVDNGDGTFSVYGSHAYFENGTFNITARITDGPYVSGDASSTATVTTAPPVVSAYNIYETTQFHPFTDQWVARFTDQYPAWDISSYSATIDWGDGHTSLGTINSGDGYYYITASYTYQTFGDIPFTVTLNKAASGEPLQTVSSSGLAYVNAASPTGNAVDLSVQAQSPTLVTVAQFTPDPAATADLFAALIIWGNGQTTAGTIVADPDNPGQFLVTGTASYSLAGDYSVTVQIVEHGYGKATMESDFTAVAHVTAVPLQVTVPPLKAVLGMLFQGQVATFIDPNFGGLPAASDFTATILWGDGQQSMGVITRLDANTFSVSGSHLYSQAGSLPLQVLIATTPITDPTVNGSFETTIPWGWQSGGDYPSQLYPWWGHTGQNSLFLGDSTDDWNDWGVWDFSSFGGSSTLTQTVVVPEGSSTLQFWTYRSSSAVAGDSQQAAILDADGNPLTTIWSGLAQDNDWVETSFDLSPYAGQTVKLAFEVDIASFFSTSITYPYTSMYVDDVAITRVDKSGSGDGTASVSPAAITLTWNGTTGNWTNASKWSTSSDFPNNGTGGFTYNVIINSGTVTLDQSITIQSLTLGDGASLKMAETAGAGSVLRVDSLVINGSGKLDLANNTMLVKYGSGVSPLGDVVNGITNGRNGGTWDGSGISSSTAAVNGSYGVGVAADAANQQVKVMYTLLGDTNLDGTVDVGDLGTLLNNYGQAGKIWSDGEFGYNASGTVEVGDLGLLLNNYGQSTATLAATTSAVVSGDAIVVNSDTATTQLGDAADSAIVVSSDTATTQLADAGDSAITATTNDIKLSNRSVTKAGRAPTSTKTNPAIISTAPVEAGEQASGIVAPFAAVFSAKPLFPASFSGNVGVGDDLLAEPGSLLA